MSRKTENKLNTEAQALVFKTKVISALNALTKNLP